MDARNEDRFDLDGGQWEALREAMNEPGNLGDDLGISCNVDADDHLHARRAGAPGSRLAGRVAVATHGGRGGAVIYIAAPQAREFAAHLLNAADELDGVTPLVFMPRTPETTVVEVEAVEVEAVEVEIVETAPETAEETEVGVTVRPAASPSLTGLLGALVGLPVGIVRGLLK